jgi:hypothetical protein
VPRPSAPENGELPAAGKGDAGASQSRDTGLTESTITRADYVPPIDGMVPEAEIRWTLDSRTVQQPQPATPDWPAIRDFRDLVIHEIVDHEALLEERIDSIEQDVQSYRTLAIESMAMNVRLTAQLDAARREIRYLKAGRR